ncbi:MAG: DUF1570 domain-containing protein [Thermoguttaceae bacterium]
MPSADRTRSPHRAALIAILVAAGLSRGALPCGAADELYRAAQQLKAAQAAEIEELAAWCETQGLNRQATETRRVLGPRDPYKLYVKILPKEVGPAKRPADASADVLEFDRRLTRLRHEQADALYDLARRAVRAGRASLAFDLVLVAIRFNPDHEPVRRVLGYQEYRGQWRTGEEVRRLRSGQVWHEKFGWLPKSHVPRYEQGMRYTSGRWVSAEEDARLHADIHSGWDIQTEHYTIRTNHSIEAAVALGVKLERLKRIWQQIFIRYYASAADVIALFDGRARRNRPPHYDVVYFRNRDDYNRALRASMPNIGVSIGVYVDQTRRAYFFAGEDYDDRTLYHEATHQLFHQTRPVPPGIGSRANFWIVEGIALYMESLHEENGYYVLGGLDDHRMYAARYRLLESKFYVPLQELAGYNVQRLQTDPRIATLYSQAAGLTHFLIYYEEGRYRDALVSYLSTVYAGRDTPGTLAELTGSSFDELDKQYRAFIESTAP